MLALTRARVKQALDGFARFVSTHVRRGRFANPFARRRCAFPASPRAVRARSTRIVSAHSDVVIRHLWDADGPGFAVWRNLGAVIPAAPRRGRRTSMAPRPRSNASALQTQ